MRRRLGAFAALITAFAAGAALPALESTAPPATGPVAQVLSPLTLSEARDWACAVEVRPLKQSGVVIDTAQAAHLTTLVHSWQVVYVGGEPYLVITVLRPRR